MRRALREQIERLDRRARRLRLARPARATRGAAARRRAGRQADRGRRAGADPGRVDRQGCAACAARPKSAQRARTSPGATSRTCFATPPGTGGNASTTRRWRAGLWGLAGRPGVGPRRGDHELVAGEGLVGLPLARAACGGYRWTEGGEIGGEQWSEQLPIGHSFRPKACSSRWGT